MPLNTQAVFKFKQILWWNFVKLMLFNAIYILLAGFSILIGQEVLTNFPLQQFWQ